MIAHVLLEGIAWLRVTSLQTRPAPALFGAAVLLPLAWRGARRIGGSGALAAGASLALLGAAEVTLVRAGPPLQDGQLASLRTCRITDAATLTPEAVLNVLLLMPAAFLAVLAIGRPIAVAAALTLVSVGIEATQAIASIGVCDSSDVVHNGFGALAAAGLAALIRSSWHRRIGASPARAA